MSRQDNFVYLTFALIALLLSTALAQQFLDHSAQHLVQSTTVITLIVAVWGAGEDKLLLRKAFVFPLAILAVAILSYSLDVTGYDHFHLFIMLAFFVMSAKQTATQVLFTGAITGNKILGAICLYLLMGLIFAIIYTLLSLSFNDAFNNMSNPTEWYSLFPDFIYFSFVTLTTLGFGDISPNLPLAKFLVYLEAIIGQFYLAVLVASLVGQRMSDMSHKTKDNHE